MTIRTIAVGLLVLPILALAPASGMADELNDTIEMVRSVAALERKAVITRGLQLTGEQSQAFWPIYDQYVADKKLAQNKVVQIIIDYAENYDTMSDAMATSIVDDHMKVQGDLLKARKKYLKKFRKVLPPKTVARFYQLENKLDAVANVQLAQEIHAQP